MTDRRDLLWAILAAPADDTPRLVYADWLDDCGTTNADAARAEFIRFALRLKSGLRSSTRAMADRLKADWALLLPTLAAEYPPSVLRARPQGRSLSVRPIRAGVGEARVYFDRGFGANVLFDNRTAFERFARALAVDEPLARFGTDRWPPAIGRHDVPCVVHPSSWGGEVFDRLAGYDEFVRYGALRDLPAKEYRPLPPADPARPWATAGPAQRARDAICDAMTALAREWNGLPLPEPA